jgi:hypothetical protein
VTGAELRKLLRGNPAAILRDALTALPGRLEGSDGQLVVGDPAAKGDRYPIALDGAPIGHLVGPPGAERIAGLARQLSEMARDRRALAEETLGRYKELALLYELSEKLSTLLDLDAVAALVVAEACRHLRADGAALLLWDARHRALQPIASVGSPPLADPIAARVFETGQSDLVEADRSLLCAPLRTGEQIAGVLLVSQATAGRWTAGDLKLVAALAAHASSAISNAQLHRDRVRELALRHRVERYVSPRLADAVRADPHVGPAVYVALCDLRGLSGLEPDAAPERLLDLVESGVLAGVQAFLAHGAAVDTPRGELVVGVFRTADDARSGAGRLARTLEARGMGGLAGVGIAPTTANQLEAGINAAALLQAESAGRIVEVTS